MEYPVGKTQKMVLDALNLTAKTFAEAEQKFEELGIVVKSKRVGKATVPEIVVKDRNVGGFSEDGDGWEAQKYDEFDTAPIAQWIMK